MLWLGRFDPEKGPDLAIEACRKADLPLVLAGKCNQQDEWRYLDEVIRPLLGPDVELVLNGDRDRTEALLYDARSLLLPIRWEEPFGMVMIEAMAKGTPVVALRRGSVPEVVLHGRTGVVCVDESDLPDALHEVVPPRPGRLRRPRTHVVLGRADGQPLRADLPPPHRRAGERGPRRSTSPPAPASSDPRVQHCVARGSRQRRAGP